MEKGISIIIPAYNESEKIIPLLRELTYKFPSAQIIVIDDGSSDDTFYKVLPNSVCSTNIHIFRHSVNYGKGAALRYGFKLCAGDIVVFYDADNEIPCWQILYYIHWLLETNADCVIASKFHPNSELHYPPFRKLMSICYFFLIKLLFGLKIRDTQTGLKVFKREVLEKVIPLLKINEFAFDIELLVRAHKAGFKIREMPVLVKMQRKSRIGKAHIFKMLADTLYLWSKL